MTPFIIAVAGMPGAGKSTLIHNAMQVLGDADSLHFDDYTRGSDYPNIPEWVAAGWILINGFRRVLRRTLRV